MSPRPSITSAHLYLVAPFQLAAGDLPALVPQLARAGVDIVQLREKELEARELLEKAEAVARACAEAGAPFIVNDRVDVADVLRRRGYDVGVHVGQGDLPPPDARELLGPDAIVGLSTHTTDEVDRAAGSPGVIDYFAVGPVHETPTKPGRPAAGLSLITYASERSADVPWFAIGGIDGDSLGGVRAAGAQRVVVLRAIVSAPDPVRAARELAEQLR